MNKALPLIFLTILYFCKPGIAQPPPGGQPSPLVINEVDYDQAGTDTAEFIELKNILLFDLPLGDWWVILYNGDVSSNTPYDTIQLPAVNLAGGDYFVICGNGGNVANCDFQVNSTSNIIQNGSPDAIALYNSTADTIWEAFSYEGTCPFPWSEGTGLATNLSDNNNDDNLGVSRIPDGMDSDDNSADFRKRCITPGASNGNDTLPCSIPTGFVNLNQAKDDIAIFPNPVQDKVSIFLSDTKAEKADVHVYDITGKLVKDQSLSLKNGLGIMYLNELPQGIYILKLKTDKLNLTRKVSVLK